jgi:hypothetical protein
VEKSLLPVSLHYLDRDIFIFDFTDAQKEYIFEIITGCISSLLRIRK